MKPSITKKKVPFVFARKELNLIAALRGLPEDYGRSRLKVTQGLDVLVEKLVKKYRWHPVQTPEKVLMAHWKDILGDHLAHRASPQALRTTGKLIICVTDPVIREELRFAQDKILNKIQAVLGQTVVKELVWVVG